MTSEADIERLLPEIPGLALAELRAAFCQGAATGLCDRGPLELEAERELVAALQQRISDFERQANEQAERSAYRQGVLWGLDLRVRAERHAALLYKYLAGLFPNFLVKRLIVRAAAAESLLAGLVPFERLLLREAYLRRYRRDLVLKIEVLFSHARAQRIRALFALAPTSPAQPFPTITCCSQAGDSGGGRIAAQDLFDVRHALDPSSKLWIGSFFLGKTAAERQRLVAEYEQRYGRLEPAVAARYRGWEREFILDLIHEGRVRWGKLLYFCIKGLGTDEEGLEQILARLSPVELQQARLEFTRVWQTHAPWYERPFAFLASDLDRRIWLESGGDAYFELSSYLFECSAQEAGGTSQHARLERLYQHERSGVLLKKLDIFSREGQRMDGDIARIRAFSQHFAPEASAERAVQLRFESLIRFGELDCEIFRALKHLIGNLATAATAGTCVAGSTLALTSQRFDLHSVMLSVALISISLRVLLKRLLKGRGYHRGELGADVFFGVLDGATLFTAYLFRQAVIRFGTKLLTVLGAKTGLMRLSRAMQVRRIREWPVSVAQLGAGEG